MEVDGYDVELNEECFQKLPLDFSGLASLRWGGLGGEQASSTPYTASAE